MRPSLTARRIIISVSLGLWLLVLVFVLIALRQEPADLAGADNNDNNNTTGLKETTWIRRFANYIVGIFTPNDQQQNQDNRMHRYQPVKRGYLNYYLRKLGPNLADATEQASENSQLTSPIRQQDQITNNSTAGTKPLNQSNYSVNPLQVGGESSTPLLADDSTKVNNTLIGHHDENQQLDSMSTNRMNREALANSHNNNNIEEDFSNVKCHDSKYDRLIAQRISQNDISKPIKTSNGRFDNPFPSWNRPSMIDITRFLVFESDESSLPKDRSELEKELPLVKPNFIRDSQNWKTRTQNEEYRTTWIGHSTLLIQVDGYNILTDPVFSERASFSQYIGPKRIREPACTIQDLPRIDIVLVSHNHYDHLDSNSVKQLNDRFGRQCRWVVPLGIGEYLDSMSVENYVELDWWQKDCFLIDKQFAAAKPVTAPVSIDSSNENSASNLRSSSPPTSQSNYYQDPSTERNNRLELDIYLTPSQHWSRRGINDVNKSLWGSFTIVSQSGSTFFFAGDTGYCSVFKEIGEVFGPFVGAAIPIGAYKPRWFLKSSHVDPAEAVQIHRDLKSMKSIAIHHSTFILSYEPYREPVKMLKEIMDQFKINGQVREPFLALKHGETVEFCKSC